MKKPAMITGVLAAWAAVLGVAQAPAATVSADTGANDAKPVQETGETATAATQLPSVAEARSTAAQAASVASKQAAVSQAQSAVNSAASVAGGTQSVANSATQKADSAKNQLDASRVAASSAADLVENYDARKSSASVAVDSTAANAAVDSRAASVAASKAASASASEATARQAASQAKRAQQTAQNAVDRANSQVNAAQKRVDTIAKVPSLREASQQAGKVTRTAQNAAESAAKQAANAKTKAQETADAQQAAVNAVNTAKQAVAKAESALNKLATGNDAKLLADAQKAVKDAEAKKRAAEAAVNAAGPFNNNEIAAMNAQISRYAQLTAEMKAIKKIYEVTPQTTQNGRFVPGKLTAAAKKNAVGWVNYYRSLFGLRALTADEALMTQAQITAAVEQAAGVMSHQLAADAERPSNVSNADWETAKKGAAESNLYNYSVWSSKGAPAHSSSAYLEELVRGWLLDDSNVNGGRSQVGHRQSLLGSTATKVGFGYVEWHHGNSINGDAALTLTPDHKGNSRMVVSFPAAKLFPLRLVNNDRVWWSVDFGKQTGYTYNPAGTRTPAVKVKNLTTGKVQAIPADRRVNTTSYSREGVSVAFKVDIKALGLAGGNEYEVIVPTEQGNYTYRFKLYDDGKKYSREEAVANAKAALSAAQTALTNAQNKLKAVQAQLGKHNQAIASATAALSAAQSRLAQEQKALATAKTAATNAKTVLTRTTAAAAKANAALAAARSAQTKAEAAYQNALAALNGQSVADATQSAQTALAHAKTTQNGAKRDLAAVSAKAAAANQTLTQAQARATSTRETAMQATVKAKASQTAATNAAATYAHFPTKEQAEANLVDAQVALVKAQENYNDTLAAREAANETNEAAQAALAVAQAQLILARKELADAQAVVDQAGVDAQVKLDAQAQLESKMALRAAFDRQLDQVDRPQTLTAPAKKTTALPQTGEASATELEVLGVLMVLTVMAYTYWRQPE